MERFEVYFKAVVTSLNSDKGGNLQTYFLKNGGYGSLLFSIEPGIYFQEAVRFPITTKEWPLRTEEWARHCEELKNYLNLSSYGGHDGLCLWSKLNCFDTYSILGVSDPMHDHLSDGIFDNNFQIVRMSIDNFEDYSKYDKYWKLTSEIVSHNVGLGTYLNKKDNKTFIDNLNFFLYIFPPLLDLMNVDETLIEIHSTLAQFYERFNSKNPLNHTNYLELIEWKGRIYKTIKLMGTRISSKIRSLLQYPFFILLNGLMWNYNSAVFESYLNSVKQAARETKKNPLLSLINYFSNIWSLNLFKSFPRNFYETLNFPTRKINFVMDYICEEKEKDLTFPTKLLTNFQYSSNGEIKTKSFYSYKRNHFITSFGKKLIISTHSSSQKLDNNDQY